MSILYWFESIRNPVLDVFFSSVTFLGHELIPIALICILYWCIDKKLAYKIGFSFFASGLTTQSLKITFRVERPWVIDPSFEPVGNAVDEATSYSFPSGHTQAATSVYSSLALTVKRNWLKILCILAFIIVGISRMYLGVHTLKDVAVSMAVTLLLTIIVFKLMDKIYDNRKYDIPVLAVLLFLSASVIAYASILYSNGTIPHEAASDCIKSGGAGLAFALGYFIEVRYIKFKTKCPLLLQIIKVTVGLLIALALKSGLKIILGESLLADGVRYFVLVAFIVILYPLIFKTIGQRSRK